MTEPIACPCCGAPELTFAPDSRREIEFFECPACRRRYARKTGGALTFRWGHPVTLALYGVLFAADPVAEAEAQASRFAGQWPPDTLRAMVEEIELELHHPTQRVRDCLDNVASEEKCRDYLRAFAAQVRGKLDRRPDL